jgi:hypothetical protein
VHILKPSRSTLLVQGDKSSDGRRCALMEACSMRSRSHRSRRNASNFKVIFGGRRRFAASRGHCAPRFSVAARERRINAGEVLSMLC